MWSHHSRGKGLRSKNVLNTKNKGQKRNRIRQAENHQVEKKAGRRIKVKI